MAAGEPRGGSRGHGVRQHTGSCRIFVREMDDREPSCVLIFPTSSSLPQLLRYPGLASGYGIDE